MERYRKGFERRRTHMARWGLAVAVICCFWTLPAGAQKDSRQWFFPPLVEFKEHHPLSNYAAMCRRCRIEPEKGFSPGHQYDLKKEKFGLYMPEVDDANDPFGLLVWIPAGGRVKILESYLKVLDKHRLIFVGVDETEKNRKSTYGRRIPLALDGAHNVMKMYNVDPNRVYVTGLSAGGRVSSIASVHYPDVFKGGIFMIGASSWEPVINPKTRRTYWPATLHKPITKYLVMARREGRYVMLTGTDDFNRLEMLSYYHRVYKRTLKNIIYLEVPGMGHEIPPPDWFEKAIEYLDRPLTKE